MLAHWDGPVFAGCSSRLSEEMVRTIVERDGVVGVALLDDVDSVCRLSGGSKHVAIGSSLDGGLDGEPPRTDLKTVSDLPQFCENLVSRGYSRDDVEMIAYGNLVRLFRHAWEVGG